jgi:hypothetical protein
MTVSYRTMPCCGATSSSSKSRTLLPRILPTHCIFRLDFIIPFSSFPISPCATGGDTEFVREHMQQQFISKVLLDTISEHEGPVRAKDTGEEH